MIAAQQRLEAPTPRVALGLALRGIASAALDVSDGLLGDLGHMLRASGVGACIDTASTSALLAARAGALQAGQPLDVELVRQCTLAGGDDYELLFTAAPSQRSAVLAAAHSSATAITCIGTIEAGAGLRLVDGQGQPIAARYASFDHFA